MTGKGKRKIGVEREWYSLGKKGVISKKEKWDFEKCGVDVSDYYEEIKFAVGIRKMGENLKDLKKKKLSIKIMMPKPLALIYYNGAFINQTYLIISLAKVSDKINDLLVT